MAADDCVTIHGMAGTSLNAADGNLKSNGNEDLFKFSLHASPGVRAGAAVPDDYASGAATKGVLQVGRSVQGTIEANTADTDSFAISLTGGISYTFTVDQSSVYAPYTSFILEDGTGQVAVPIWSQGNTFSYTPYSSGTYYVTYGKGISSSSSVPYKISAAYATDDAAGNTSTSAALQAGVKTSGIINTDGDRDWYKITLDAGTVYEIDLNDSSLYKLDGSYPPYDGRSTLQLIDASGSLLKGVSTGFGHTKFSYTPAATAAYFVGVAGGWNIGGQYDLSVSKAKDDYAATTATTGVLAVGGSAQGSLLTQVSDADWFKVTLDANKKYKINLSLSGSITSDLAYTELQMFDANGNALVGSSLGASPQAVFTPQTSANYYVQVKGIASNAAETYTVRLSEAGANEQSTGISDARTVVLDSDLTGKLESAGDTDWFKVELQQFVTYRFDTSKSLLSPNLKVYDSHGHQEIMDLGYSEHRFVPWISGTYYLAISGNYNTVTPSYNSYTVRAFSDDYDSSTKTTGKLAIGTSSSGKLETSYDSDWFAITLQAGEAYVFKTTDTSNIGSSSNVVSDLSIYDDTGVRVQFTSPTSKTGELSTSYIVPKTGIYFVSVGASFGSLGSYQLTASIGPKDDYSADSSSTARLTTAAPLQGKLEIAGDQDWIGIPVSAGDNYTAVIQGTASDGTALNLYPSIRSGPGLGFGSQTFLSADSSRVSFHATESGITYLSIGNVNSNAGSYTVNLINQGKDDYGLRDQPGHMQVGGMLHSKLDFAGDQDVIEVQLQAYMTYRFTFASSDMPTGGTLYLMSTNFYPEQFASQGSAGQTASFDYRPYLDGTYYLRVNHGSGETGSYSVLVGRQDLAASTLVGTSGNDTFTGAYRGDTIEGGAGLDTVRYSESRSTLVLNKVEQFQTANRIGSDLAADMLYGVERLVFSDGAIALDSNGTGGQAYRLYRAAFDRTPDEVGLGFWMHALDGGETLQKVAQYFVTSGEFTAKNGDSTSNGEFIDILYRNVLHRTAEQAGHQFWTNALDQGSTRAEVLVYFSESAENQAAVASVIGAGFAYQPY